MTGAVTALFAFFSISIFLAHTFDAYRSRLRPPRPDAPRASRMATR
jgi:hypothetical protein